MSQAYPGTRKNEGGVCICNTCWHIWKARCKAAFENKMPNPMEVVDDIRKAHDEYMRAKIVSATTPGVRVTQA